MSKASGEKTHEGDTADDMDDGKKDFIILIFFKAPGEKTHEGDTADDMDDGKKDFRAGDGSVQATPIEVPTFQTFLSFKEQFLST